MKTNVRLVEARVTSVSPEAEVRQGKEPRQHLIEVSFPAAPVSLYAMVFTNYYCAAISVSHTSTRSETDPLLQLHMKGRAPTWQVAVPKLALMADPHCEVRLGTESPCFFKPMTEHVPIHDVSG